MACATIAFLKNRAKSGFFAQNRKIALKVRLIYFRHLFGVLGMQKARDVS